MNFYFQPPTPTPFPDRGLPLGVDPNLGLGASGGNEELAFGLIQMWHQLGDMGITTALQAVVILLIVIWGISTIIRGVRGIGNSDT